MDPAILTVAELTDGLRAGAAGSYPAEAATELLIRHWTWLTRPSFLRRSLRAVHQATDLLSVDWEAVHEYVVTAEATPADRAIALIAVGIGHLPSAEALDAPQPLPPLGWLLVSLERREVDLVLAAIAHAAGTHRQVEHVGEPDSTGKWRTTSSSPRIALDVLHNWPVPSISGLGD